MVLRKYSFESVANSCDEVVIDNERAGQSGAKVCGVAKDLMGACGLHQASTNEVRLQRAVDDGDKAGSVAKANAFAAAKSGEEPENANPVGVHTATGLVIPHGCTSEIAEPENHMETLDVDATVPYLLQSGWLELVEPISWERPVSSLDDSSATQQTSTRNNGNKGSSAVTSMDVAFLEQCSMDVHTGKERKQDATRADDLPPLPLGWVELVDPTSGRVYYWHEADSMTTWERPIELLSYSVPENCGEAASTESSRTGLGYGAIKADGPKELGTEKKIAPSPQAASIDSSSGITNCHESDNITTWHWPKSSAGTIIKRRASWPKSSAGTIINKRRAELAELTNLEAENATAMAYYDTEKRLWVFPGENKRSTASV